MSENTPPTCGNPTVVRLKVTPGEVVVSRATFAHRSEQCALIEIDCESKYPQSIITGDISPDRVAAIGLYADENTRNTDESRKGEYTDVIFIDFTGWEVFSIMCGRYTVRVALHKADK